jgi:thymidylate synthase (FAD)
MTQIKATLIDHMGSDLSVVNAARVSFGKKSEWETLVLSWQEYEDQPDYEAYSLHETFYEPYAGVEVRKLPEKDAKLIRYLAKHKHLSPFGHAFASFHVKAPIFVARQMVKHKFLRWNEISRRYVDDEPEFYEPDVWRGRSADKKQGSKGVVDLDSFEGDYGTLWGDVEEAELFCQETYKRMLNAGVAPEQARMVLPQSTMTEWYWSGSLDAFASMCKLRCASDTQYESRIVANQISELMGTLFPVSWNALMKGQDDE